MKDAKDLLKYMKTEVNNLNTLLPLHPADIIKWLDQLEGTLDDIERERGENDQTPPDQSARLATYAQESENIRENFRGVIMQGQGVIKITSLINGGAAVAMLAFIGTLIKEGRIYPGLLHIFSLSIFLFVIGVLASALSSGTTYLFQACYGQGSSKSHKLFVSGLHVSGITLIIISYLCFFLGSMEAIEAFLAIRN